MTNATRSRMKIFRRPKRSVRWPKMGPPKKMPASDDAPSSPSSTVVRSSAVEASGSTTLMTPRS
jgi:hypothetical protein